MNLFAGTITLETELSAVPVIDFDVIRIDTKNFFVMGGLEEENISYKDIITLLEKSFGKIQYNDITLEGEMRIEILMEESEEGGYESVTFEGPFVDIDDIISRFAESEAVITAREIGRSEIYGNMKVRVDFLY